MILDKKYFQKKTGHNRGPPQQTYYLGSYCSWKKWNNWNKQIFRQQLDTIEDHHNKHINYLGSILPMKNWEILNKKLKQWIKKNKEKQQKNMK